jgi:hypothetical protein
MSYSNVTIATLLFTIGNGIEVTGTIFFFFFFYTSVLVPMLYNPYEFVNALG